jgi:hypothetical protein
MPVNRKINPARTDEEIQNCCPVIGEPRPHISEHEFLPRVKRQMNDSGFKLVYLNDERVKAAVVGFRIAEWLSGGKYLKIGDPAAKHGCAQKVTAARFLIELQNMPARKR